MISQLCSKHTSLLGLVLLLTLLDIASAMYVTKVRRIPISALGFRESGLLSKRALDMLDGNDFSGMKKRALDSLEGTGFGGFEKRALDSLDGTGFGFDMKKRALDMLDGTGFGMRKRSPSDRYIRISADELNLLENIKRELRAEVRRRRMLAEEAQQRLLD